jgi:hypothetical protein
MLRARHGTLVPHGSLGSARRDVFCVIGGIDHVGDLIGHRIMPASIGERGRAGWLG